MMVAGVDFEVIASCRRVCVLVSIPVMAQSKRTPSSVSLLVHTYVMKGVGVPVGLKNPKKRVF